MTEIYVYFEGSTPVEVIYGRRDALARLLHGMKVTPDERSRIRRFQEGGLCDLGTGLLIVGFPPALPDRRIIRVLGPGTEV